MRRIWIGLVIVSAVAGIAACISDEPASSVTTGPDAGVGATGCATQTVTPGNCSVGREEFCFRGEDVNAKPGCFASGTGPRESCATDSVIGCLAGGRSCSNKPCCFGGKVSAGTSTCAKDLSPAALFCDSPSDIAEQNARFQGRPCIEPSLDGTRLAIVCADTAECARYDAGTCTNAFMGPPVNAVFGVCSDYDP